MSREEDFDDQLISETVAVVNVPRLQVARPLTSRQNTSFQETHTISGANTDRIDIQKILYGGMSLSIQKHPLVIPDVDSQLQKRQEKIRIKKQQLMLKQMEECTFKPKTNQQKTGKPHKRTLQQFLQAQNSFCKRVDEKRENLKMYLNENRNIEATFKPKVNKSQSTCKSRTRQPVFERLYDMRNNKQNSEMTSRRIKQEATFAPQITDCAKKLIRDSSIGEHLYDDAMRRLQIRKNNINSKDTQKTVKGQKQREINLTNQKYVAQKFIKEYYGVIEQFDLLNKRSLVYQDFLSILIAMGFASESNLSVLQHYVNEAYSYLQQTAVNVKNLCVFLMAIVGIFNINPINFEEKEDEYKQLQLDQNTGRKIQRKYDILFRNRLSAEQLKKVQPFEQASFRPQINSQSEILAENYRAKMLQQAESALTKYQLNSEIGNSGVITHAQLLILSKLGRQAQIKRMRQATQNQAIAECTFKPRINQKNKSQTHSHMNESKTDASSSRCQQLYQLARSARLINYMTPVEQEFQRNKQECTFKPKTNQGKIIRPSSDKNAKDFDKAIIRMHQGRRLRQKKKIMLGQIQRPSVDSQSLVKLTEKDKKCFQSNHTKRIVNKKNQNQSESKQHEEYQKNIPFLMIDVNLGETVQQIVIFKQDTGEPEKLAKQFGRRHGLDINSIQRLGELLRQEINSILDKIQEQEEVESVE